MAYLGFESGGTKLVVSLSYDGATIVDSRKIDRPLNNTAEQSLATLLETALDLVKEHGLGEQSIQAIGFGFGGSVNSDLNKPLICLHEEGWSELGAADQIRGHFRCPVYWINDCEAAALAEASLVKQVSHMFYVTLGTGVGGALVSNRRIFRTSAEGNSEVGHLLVDDDFHTPCPCGSSGCLEAVCSGPGLLRLAKRMFPEEGIIAPEQVTASYLAGHPKFQEVMEKYILYLAKGLASVMTLYHPERIVLGGGLGKFVAEQFQSRLEEGIRDKCYPPFRQSVSIHAWTAEEQAVGMGAMMYAREQLGYEYSMTDRLKDNNE
ncbi:ROK family protein [Paenibacillus chungangensis]|uniref:ROK family protein n=1 Tax=Paenibacillus chungangensis TaxID=696535 RepID=A0ABW3HR21_9BACL